MSQTFESPPNTEIWVAIKGYEREYEVSSSGNIRSKTRVDSRGQTRYSTPIKTFKSSNGYIRVQLCSRGTRIKYLVHRLVAENFIPITDDLKINVNHIDGVKSNNYVGNLEWVTKSENTKHSYANKLQSKVGERHHLSILTEDSVLQIRYRFSKGETKSHLADEMGVSYSTIRAVLERRSWRHI